MEPWTTGRVNWCDTCVVKTGLGCAWRHSYTSKQTHKLTLSEQETHLPKLPEQTAFRNGCMII